MRDMKRQVRQFKFRLQPIVQFVAWISSALHVDFEGARPNLLLCRVIDSHNPLSLKDNPPTAEIKSVEGVAGYGGNGARGES
jgi:hypothetical protein